MSWDNRSAFTGAGKIAYSLKLDDLPRSPNHRNTASFLPLT
jgi:hypothetical protein